MKIGYIVAIISIALMIVLSGCAEKEPAPATPGDQEQPAAPADGEAPVAEAPTEETGEQVAPVEVPTTDVQREISSAPAGTEILSGFGCDASSKSLSFTVTNVGEKTLTIDNGQGLTGGTYGAQVGEQNDWIKVMFNGRALRMLNCEKLELAPGEMSKCSQSEGLVFRTAVSSAYSDVAYNQLLIKTQSGDHKKQVYCS